MLQENQKKELLLLEDLGMIYATEKSKKKSRYGLYRCICGNEKKIRTSDVKNGKTKSCGCLSLEISSINGKNNTTHGLTNHRLYGTWTQMKKRCSEVNSKRFSDYGGRGISVCDRWLKIENFIEDMFPTYENGLSLDRINVNGNYEKDNCRWATNEVQTQNSRLRIDNKTGYRGVCFDKSMGKFRAKIQSNKISKILGYFSAAIEAAKAYDNYVIANKLEHTINGV